MDAQHNQPQTPRHPDAARPLQETAEALRVLAASSPETMSADVKAMQRRFLMQHAIGNKEEVVTAPTPVASAPVPPKKSNAGNTFRRWFLPMGGFAMAAAAIVLAVVLLPRIQPGTTPGTSPATTFARILIPEAHAGDVFTLYAEKGDAAGADTDSSWLVKSQVAVTTEQIKQTLRIVPAIETEVQKVDDTTFKIIPKEPLLPGKVYKVQLATDIKKEDGTLQAREFSWAIQTKNVFRVLSSIPGDKTANVPVNTGIEFKFSYPNVRDPKDAFSIFPTVNGRFEVRGRTVSFVPEKPLENGKIYEVRLNKGYGVKDSTLGLADDVVIRFETEARPKTPEYANVVVKPRLSVREFNVVTPGQDLYLFENGWYGYGGQSHPLASSSIAVVGYRVDAETAAGLLSDRAEIPEWQPVRAAEFAAYTSRTTGTPAWTTDVQIQPPFEYGTWKIQLPAQAQPGLFLIKITPKDGEDTYAFVQVTNHATHLIADTNTLQAWSVNASTNRVQSGVQVRAGSVTATTDANGLARLPTELLRATSTNAANGAKPHFVLLVGDEKDTYLTTFAKDSFREQQWNNYGYGMNIDTYQTWSYLMQDRSLYRGTDELKTYGFAQDRNTRKGVGSVTVELLRQGAWEWYDFFGNRTVIDTQTVQTNAAGHFEATFAWRDLAPGYYTVAVRRADQTSYLTSKSFEVRDFQKPTYTLDVKVDQQRVYGGSKVTGQVQARFFDGTPFANSKLVVHADQYGRDVDAEQVVTDADGVASFTLDTVLPECDKDRYSCVGEEYYTVTVRPESGEEAEIVASASLSVLRSELDLYAMSRATGTQGTLRIQTMRNTLDLQKSPTPWANREVKVSIKEFQYLTVEEGTYYDFYLKKTFPKYRYEVKEGKPIERTVKTDASGSVDVPFTANKGHWYEATLEAQDDVGRIIRARPYLSTYWWDWQPLTLHDQYWADEYPDDRWPNLAVTPNNEQWSFKEGEKINFEFRRGKNAFPLENTPGVLSIVASRGLREATVHPKQAFTLDFPAAYVPSMEVRVVTFKDGKFVTARRSIQVDVESRRLNVTATPDQANYAPGSQVKVNVDVRDQQGNRVPFAKVALTSVDAALEALSPSNFQGPLSMYGYLWDGIVVETWSHDYADPYGFGGAEKGGGGGDYAMMQAAVRKNFKDTASFQVATTDQEGHATIAFTAPDNLTTWNTTIAAISDSALAGDTSTKVIVSKSVFVDAVVAPRLLSKDKPVLKLRAYGIGLKKNEAVTFIVDAPSLGLLNQKVEGRAFEPMYVAIDKLVPGKHTIVLRVGSTGGVDALERIVTVVDTRYEKDTEVQIEAFPGATLPDVGREQVSVVFTSQAQGSLLPEVRSLWYGQWDPRVDARVAGRVAAALLKDLYKYPEVEIDTENLRAFQDGQSGGIRLLPYGSADAELTAEVLATAPEFFDRQLAASYFYKELETGSRETQASALAGLAALGEPVLLSLEEMTKLEDLSPREALTLARGFDAAGAKERARHVLDALLKAQGETRGTVKLLKVSDKEFEVYEATADAAALAATTAHPDAEALMRFVQENWTNDAFPLLARARYLKAMAPMRPAGDVSVSYTLDGKTEETISLREWPVTHKFFSRDQIKAFRVTKVVGPVVLSLTKTEAGRPAQTSDLAIRRDYDAGKPLDQLKEGDAVTVKIRVEYADTAQDGCYHITDYLPGNLQPMLAVNYGWWGRSWYPYDVREGRISFVGCKDVKNPTEIEYQARVVSRGTYTAEAPNVQHQDHPTASAIGNDLEVTVK